MGEVSALPWSPADSTQVCQNMEVNLLPETMEGMTCPMQLQWKF